MNRATEHSVLDVTVSRLTATCLVAAAGLGLIVGCVSVRPAPPAIPEPLTLRDKPGGHAPLARGPIVQRATDNGVTIMGRPVNEQLEETVTVMVTPENGKARSATGVYDAARDSFVIRVEGLPRNTVCSYTVSVGDQAAGPFHFVTALPSGDPTPFRFGVYGDTRSNWGAHWSIANQFLTARPRFSLVTGDLVANGDNFPSWDTEYFGPACNLAAYVDLWPCHGNHDGNQGNLLKVFDIPQMWYAREYGCLKVITMASYSPWNEGSEQYEWVKQELSKPWPGWLAVQMHAPPFGCNPGRALNYAWINGVVPLLLEHGVDMILSGHDHYYMRSKPIALEVGQKGIVQIVAGGGGAPIYGADANQPHVAAAKSAYHYVIVDVTPEALHVQTIQDQGIVIDDFSIEKDAPQPDFMLAPRSNEESWRAAP